MSFGGLDDVSFRRVSPAGRGGGGGVELVAILRKSDDGFLDSRNHHSSAAGRRNWFWNVDVARVLGLEMLS